MRLAPTSPLQNILGHPWPEDLEVPSGGEAVPSSGEVVGAGWTYLVDGLTEPHQAWEAMPRPPACPSHMYSS
jgi:hypothetical protein